MEMYISLMHNSEMTEFYLFILKPGLRREKEEKIKKGWGTERDWGRESPIHWFTTQVAATARNEPGQSQAEAKPGTSRFTVSAQLVIGAHTLRPSAAAFLRE